MSVVFVHGVPDTPRVWDAVVSRLDRKDVVRQSLPGFGCSLPKNFGATKEAYVEWLLGELRALKGPIDLVGHDWGGLLVVRAGSVRPEAVRNWAAGGAPLDREYMWHQAARARQTPGMGERVLEGLTPEALQAALVAAGVPVADAATATGNLDDTMKQCILKLYRSAVTAGAEWEDDLRRVSAPGSSCGREGSVRAGGVRRAPRPEDPRAARVFSGLLALVAARASRRSGRRAPASLGRGLAPSPYPLPWKGRGDRVRRSGASPFRRRA